MTWYYNYISFQKITLIHDYTFEVLSSMFALLMAYFVRK